MLKPTLKKLPIYLVLLASLLGLSHTALAQANYVPSKPADVGAQTDLKAVSISDFGAKQDGLITFDGAATAGTNVITSPSTTFTAANIGQYGALSGAANNGLPLVFKIVSLVGGDPHSVNVDPTGTPDAGTPPTSVVTTVSGKRLMWGTDNTAAVNSAKNSGYHVIVPAASATGMFFVRGTITLTRPCAIKGEWGAALMAQLQYGQPVFKVTTGGDQSTITGINFLGLQDRVLNSLASSNTGQNDGEAIYLYLCNRTAVRDCNFNGTNGGVKILNSASSPSVLYQHNSVKNCTFYGCDQGVLYIGQDGLVLDGLQSYNTTYTQFGTPPHTIYGSGANNQRSQNCIITNITVEGNPYAGPVRIKFNDWLTCSNFTFTSVERFGDFQENYSSTYTNLTGGLLTDTSALAALSTPQSDTRQCGWDWQDCVRCSATNIRADVSGQAVQGILARYSNLAADGTSQQNVDVRFADCEVVTTSTAASGPPAFDCQAGTRVTFDNCTVNNMATSPSQYGFWFEDSPDVTGIHCVNCGVSNPRIIGTSRFVKIDSLQSSTRLRIDTDKVYSSITSSAISDTGSGTRLKIEGVSTFTLTVNSATPDVTLVSLCKTANTSATALTGFTGMARGQIFTILPTDSLTTIATGLSGIYVATPWSSNTKNSITFESDGTTAHEIGRSN